MPLDSRIRDTQGIAVLDTDGGGAYATQTDEILPYARKGFRGACISGDMLCLCTSFSVKFYRICEGSDNRIRLDFVRQVQRPEWLVGRGANADLHIPYVDPDSQEIWIANSYMDCIDRLSPEGVFLGRRFLWEISPEIEKLVCKRNPKAADLCHINYFARIGNETVVTLCNLNGSGLGAVMSLDDGILRLKGLARPHDGVWHGGDFFITETHRNRLLIYENVAKVSDLDRRQPRIIEISNPDAAPGDGNRFWLRGLHVTDRLIYLGCSQFQDRETGEAGAIPSHIIVIDRQTGTVTSRLPIPVSDSLANPVIYSLLDLDTVLMA